MEMSKLFGLSSFKTLEQLRSRSASGAGAAKTIPIASRASSDSVPVGSFANLKLTAEKLVKEQASAKSDLELANSKLKKVTEHVHVLEEKLRSAYNDNAKLKVKQKEDEKLWKGLESKFSSTKTLCDQLTETLQHLAGQVREAEEDKAYFEDKLSATWAVLDNLHDEMKSLSMQLELSEGTLRNRENELKELSVEKEEMEKSLRDEKSRAASLITGKDAKIKNLEATVAANGLTMDNLNSKFKQLNIELKVKEEGLLNLRNSKEKLEKETSDLVSKNKDLASKLDMALQKVKNLEDFVKMLTLKFTELENQSLTFSEKVVQLNSLYESCFKLAEEEKNLAAQCAKQKIDLLQSQNVSVTSEKNALYLVNEELNNKVIELQKEQEFAVVQHAEECRFSEEKIRRLESEAEALISKKTEMEFLITKLQKNFDTLSENSRSSEKKMQDLLQKHSSLETLNKDQIEMLRKVIEEKDKEIDALQKEIEKSKEHIDSLEKQISQLDSTLEEKSQLVLELKDREKQMEDQKAEIQAALTNAESKLVEAKKQYDQMLESKQLELSRHLKEISQRNDQAINEMRKKYEVEKQESVNLEKEQAEKKIAEMERKCGQKLEECNEESKKNLIRVQDEYAALVSRIQQDHGKKELNLISKHNEELRRVQLQAENELREKTTSLRNEHEAQLRAMRVEHEDECRRLQEELDIQKDKEEKQRALLQLQWRVMSEDHQEDQEVNSKKNYSISSAKMRNSDNSKRIPHVEKSEMKEKDSPYVNEMRSPVSNYMKKVEKSNKGSAMSLPKHSRKVTHHEYEVETTNGRTITKKRKTKSTVMFGNGKRGTPKANTPRNAMKDIKGVRATPSNIGDLFSEGSLNPYTDDPYAFG